MTRAKELAGLIERLEAAAGPDREIDKAIFAYLGYTWRAMDYWSADSTKMWSGPVFLTYSIDAALALVERLLPGIFWVIGQGKTNSVEKLFGCQLLFGTEEIIGSGESDHAPLAILLALLKALQESHDAQ
jgi:hypothetical protein